MATARAGQVDTSVTEAEALRRFYDAHPEIDLVAGDEFAPVSPCADLDGTEAETDWFPIDPIYVKGKFKDN